MPKSIDCGQLETDNAKNSEKENRAMRQALKDLADAFERRFHITEMTAEEFEILRRARSYEGRRDE